MSVAGHRFIALLGTVVLVAATFVVVAAPAQAEQTAGVAIAWVLAQDDGEADAAADGTSKERIAFVSTRDPGEYGIRPLLYTMNVDGTDVVQVTDTSTYMFYTGLAWSPDGVYLAYSLSDYATGSNGIRGIAASGGSYEILVPFRYPDPHGPGPWDFCCPDGPAWSPDGDLLAFGADDSIWLMDLATGVPTKITDGYLDRHPAWSPDGSRLAFTRFTPYTGPGTERGQLWIVNADGSGLMQLTTPAAPADDGHPDWSPDGTQIVFHHRDGSERRVFVIDVDGSNEQQLTTETGSDPVWSPDGTRIAFDSGRDGGGPEIYVMDADGSNPVRLTNAGGSDPAWRRVPDPVTDVDMVVLGGAGVRTGEGYGDPDPWIPGAVSEAVATELDLLTSGTVTRLAGSDRYGTAVEISKAHFLPGVPVVYVATGENYPDALTSGAAAGYQGGAVLLVAANSIPSVVSQELERLTPQRIVVVGGTGVVSEAVATQLAAYTTGTVTRLGGQDRYGTAAAVSNNVFSPGVDVAYIATGENFPDALPAAAAAGALGGPLLLVQQDAIPSATATELTRLAPKRIVIAGEADVVSDAVAADLADYTTGPVEREAGPDRFATAAAISRAVRPGGASTVFIATGADYPDGVTASPAAIMADAPLLLVWTDFLPTVTRRELIRLGAIP